MSGRIHRIVAAKCVIAATIVLAFGCSTVEVEPEQPVANKYYITTTATNTLTGRQIKQMIAQQLSGSSYAQYLDMIATRDVTISAITYSTTSPDGEAITASGTISYPTDRTAIKGIIIAMHGTIATNEESPSSTMMPVESALSMLGYVVVEPDYLGFGASSSMIHPYIHYQSSSRTTIDMWLAAKEFLTTEDISAGQKNYCTGYSEGGYAAMAFQKRAQEELGNSLSLTRVIAGGGPYDPQATSELVLENDYTEYPYGIVATIVGLNYADQLNIDLDRLFKEPLKSNHTKWFVDKTTSAAVINNQLGNRPSDWIDKDYLETISATLTQSLAANSLVDKRKPSTPITLIHATDDGYVPYVNAQKAYDALFEAGATVELKSCKGNHNDGAVEFITQLMLMTIF